MGKTVLDISMSLDGYITAAERHPDQPLGRGGEQLHQWLLGDDQVSLDYFARVSKTNGAVITGRVNYEDSLPWWGSDGPTGDLRLPVVVVTHAAPADSPREGVYEFVTDGLESAVAVARERTAGKDVTIMGGATLAQSFLNAGLIDEISLHIVPVLFGQGTRLFDGMPDRHRKLALVEAVPAARAVHVRYELRDGV